MDTPQRAETRLARDAVKLPRGWTEHPLGELPRPALTGTMLDDRFELLGRLGEGGMADLYLSDDRLLRCKVAVKILRDDSPDSRARFLREAEVLSNVHHENLVDVFARGTVESSGMPYTVLRFLPGEDLKTRLFEGGPLPWATVVEIGAQIANVLMALHDAGVLHRDVKPENILWTHHTSRRVFVKLIDLGAARLSARFQGRQDRSYTPVCGRRGTSVGAAVGTPGYMPPEAGLNDPDARTDIFALGVTLYQLCTGTLPDDPLSPTPVRALNPGAQIPEDLERVIMSALHWNADMRTPSAARIHDELSALRAVHVGQRDEGLFDGRIELREHLATGAEAEVFRAYHRKLRRPVALKRLIESLQGNPDDRARFEREAWVLASARHVGLPEVYDSGVADGRAYTIMELCPGRPARRFCDDDATRLRVDEVISVGIQVAEAVQAVHAIGVIHRDLSAQNVLIEAGREPRVKVIDFTGCLLTDRFFGLRDEPRPEGDLEVTRDRALHTLPFAAPEVRADRRWSERSDVFALGVLLYRMLTGKLPYTTKARDRYIRLPLEHPGHSVDCVLEAMLRPNPAERLPDMRSVVERLRDLLEQEADCDETPPARPQLALVTTSGASSVTPTGPAEATLPSVVALASATIDAGDDAAPAAPPSEVDTGVAGVDRDVVAAAPPVSVGASGRMRRALSAGLLAGLPAGLLAALLWAPGVPTPAATTPARAPVTASSPLEPHVQPTVAERMAPSPAPASTAALAAPPEQAAPRADGPAPTPSPRDRRSRLPQDTVKRLLAAPMSACDNEWLALTLNVADQVGRVEKINGFTPKVDGAGRIASRDRCVVDAVAGVRFPRAAPDRLTVRFRASTAENGGVSLAPGLPDPPVP